MQPPWLKDLLHFVRERRAGARIHVCAGEPGAWREVRSLDGLNLIVESGEPVPLNATTAFVVAYASGEILATSTPIPKNLPAGAYFIHRGAEGSGDALSEAEIADASTCVTVSFGPVRELARRRRVYETRLTNRCAHPVRVTHFGGYAFRDGLWRLSTIVDGFFTDKQFREWYGTPDDGWLAPGASAADRDNYGADAIWVYFFETADGTRGKAVGRAPA